MTIAFARRLFLVAGIYGVIAVAPLFFLEKQIGESDPPAITHAEFYYGFACVTLAWQFVYLMLSRDPLRYRPVLLPAILGKMGFALSVMILFANGRLALASVFLPAIDLVLAGFFVSAFVGLQSPT
jgi:hypothetical protein